MPAHAGYEALGHCAVCWIGSAILIIVGTLLLRSDAVVHTRYARATRDASGSHGGPTARIGVYFKSTEAAARIALVARSCTNTTARKFSRFHSLGSFMVD